MFKVQYYEVHAQAADGVDAKISVYAKTQRGASNAALKELEKRNPMQGWRVIRAIAF